MQKEHRYSLAIKWTGNKGTGTSSYRSYDRSYQVEVENKPGIPGSSDPAFRGDPTRYNPEELLVASISSCHMLWYLHLCAVNGIVVVRYEDEPVSTLLEDPGGTGRFTEVTLRPLVVIKTGDGVKAQALHHEAHKFCFV